jgi:hypothetical protein
MVDGGERRWGAVATRGVAVAAVLAATLTTPVVLVAKPPVTAVYVTSSRAAGVSGTEVNGLEDAARELRRAIAHRKGLRVVDAPELADVQVEVTNREQRDAGAGGYGGIKLTPLGEMIIRFNAKFTSRKNGAPGKDAPQDAEVDLKGIGPGYWSRAAKDGAERLAKWIADQREREAPHKGAPYRLSSGRRRIKGRPTAFLTAILPP